MSEGRDDKVRDIKSEAWSKLLSQDRTDIILGLRRVFKHARSVGVWCLFQGLVSCGSRASESEERCCRLPFCVRKRIKHISPK